MAEVKEKKDLQPKPEDNTKEQAAVKDKVKIKAGNKGSILSLTKDLWTWLWADDDSQSQKVIQDIGQIEAGRNSKKLALAKKQQRQEAKARAKAQAKAKKIQAKLLKARQAEEAKQKKEAVKKDKSLLANKKDKTLPVGKLSQQDRETSMQHLANHKFEQTDGNLGGLLDHKEIAGLGGSAVRAGILKKHQEDDLSIFGSQPAKKQSWLARLFGSRPKLAKSAPVGGKFQLSDNKFKPEAIDVQAEKAKPAVQAEPLLGQTKIKPVAEEFTAKPIGVNLSNVKPEVKTEVKAPETKPVAPVDLEQIPEKPVSAAVKAEEVATEEPLATTAKPVDKNDYTKHKKKMAKRLAAERQKYADNKIREDIENRYWHSHDIVRANLIKEQEALFFNWNSKILTLVLALGLAGLTVGILYGGLLVWESNKLKKNSYIFENLDSVNMEINKEEAIANEILNFNDKLVLVDFILDNHIYWTNFFKFLEDYTIMDAYYEGFSGDISGEYALPTVAKDFRSIYLQIKLMQKYDKVMSANTESAKQQGLPSSYEDLESRQGAPEGTEDQATTIDRIKFVLDLVVDRRIFLR